MKVQTIGIIGAGTMGSGIAQACAQSGLDVVMQDIDEQAVARGVQVVDKSLSRLVSKEKMTDADKQAVLKRIRTSTDAADLAADYGQNGAELVILEGAFRGARFGAPSSAEAYWDAVLEFLDP